MKFNKTLAVLTMATLLSTNGVIAKERVWDGYNVVLSSE